MKLKYVTLTGADNSIQPEELVKLSAQYPYVEWAILFSQSKAGVPRYPSLDWVYEFCAAKTPEMNLAAHLCGKWVDDAINGEMTFWREKRFVGKFARLQLNMGKERLQRVVAECAAHRDSKFQIALATSYHPVIFGGNYSHVPIDSGFFFGNCLLPLFDASGGRGVLTKDWPKPFVRKDGGPMLCGYAGGLGPENVADELTRIAEVVGDGEIWIDMETKLRSGVGTPADRFDLEKCEQVLKAAAPWVG